MKIIIVGCGLSGATIARILAENNYEVEIIDRRNHIGGNLFDYYDDYGLLIQKYGPHAFHTNDANIYNFIKKYSDWIPYNLTCGASWDGICTPTPFNFKTIDQHYPSDDAKKLKNHIKSYYKNIRMVSVLDVLNCDDSLIKQYAKYLFDNDYSLYTAKQWGVAPNKIDPSVLKRVPLRFSYDEGYFDDIIQVTPTISYSTFFDNLLHHPKIHVKLNTEALDYISIVNNKAVLKNSNEEVLLIYTGALDQLFNFEFGRLPYRSLYFEFKHSDIEHMQDYPIVAYPKALEYTRITDYSQLPLQKGKGATYAIEYPIPYHSDKNVEPYYPVLTNESIALYQKYRKKASCVSNMVICGRLADFKYYNMDQAIGHAMSIVKDLLSRCL